MPISFQENLDHDTEIALWRITESADELMNQLGLIDEQVTS